MHDHGNRAEYFRPAGPEAFIERHHQCESRLYAELVPDAEFVRFSKRDGLVRTGGGQRRAGPDGRPVGPTDQVSKIRTFNIAPAWTRVVNANTVFTFGGFARQDQYNYYPSADPFADLIPGLQTETIGQNRRLTNLGLRASVSLVKGIHNIKIGATWQDTILTENDTLRDRRSDIQCGVFECRREPEHRIRR